MKKIYAVIDTNVIVSGFLTKNTSSPTASVLEYLTQGLIIPLYCTDIIKEYRDVLHREKFNLPEEKINWIMKLILSDGISSSRISSDVSLPDPKDVVFYEVALSKDDSYLITGNVKHFPKVNCVVTPAEIIEIIEKNKDL